MNDSVQDASTVSDTPAAPHDPRLDPQVGDRLRVFADSATYGCCYLTRIITERTRMSVVYIVMNDHDRKWIFGPKRSHRVGPFMVPMSLWADSDHWQAAPGSPVIYEVGK